MTNSTASEHYSKASIAFLAGLKGSSQNAATYNQYTQVLTEFGDWLNGHTDNRTDGPTEITPLIVSEYKQALFARGVKNNTVLHYLTMLRAFFKWAIDNKLYTEQPVTKSLLPSAEQIKHDIPTIEEINLLLSGKQPRYARHSTMQRNRAIVTLFIQSGLRVSELCNLRIRDLDFENENVYVDHGKGAKSRYAPFPPIAQKNVQEYIIHRRIELKPRALSQDAFLFVGDDGEKPLTRQAVTKLVSGYVARLTGHKGIGAHDLRHAAASLWDDRGANIRDVQKALGHSSVQTTERVYVQILNRSRAASNISKLFAVDC